jgi:hypothetical protein
LREIFLQSADFWIHHPSQAFSLDESVDKAAGWPLSTHEGQGWREAADRERGVAVSGSEPFRGLAEGGDELGVLIVELPAHAFPDRVERGCGRSLEARGTMMRVPAEDRTQPQGLVSRSLPPGRGFGFDLADQAGEASFPCLCGEILPAG